MASAADLRELEHLCPWLEDDFRADLALLADSTSDAARRYADDARVLARLIARVPRCPGDESGATPWTSFRREVALARKVSDRAAAAQIRAAQRLTTVLDCTLAQLDAGLLTVPRATALITELEAYDDDLAGRVDRDLAERAARLQPWRIVQEVRRAVLRHDPDAAAQRVAVKDAGRSVDLLPDVDDQATVCITGPAVPLQRWYATLDARARALRQAGDPRTLDALRFDLATGTWPCETHAPAAPDDVAVGITEAAASPVGLVVDHVHGTPCEPGDVEPAQVDCRRSRPVQVSVMVPVETALGLSNEPAWLDGHGWISAPTCRELLVDAELRRVCVQRSTGIVVDVAARDVRPPPTPVGVREALLGMVLGDVVLDDVGWRNEPQHDPTDRLRDYVVLRDRFCDGPTGARVTARRAELDHELRWSEGPTAAWNLVARAQRTHQLKHHGWTPLRTATGTVWISPAGQIAEVPRHGSPSPGTDPGDEPWLPDADELAHVDRLQLTAAQDSPPWLPATARTAWTWLAEDAPVPF